MLTCCRCDEMDLFPISVSTSQVRGLIKLIREFKRPVDIADLIEESEHTLETLIPLIDASRLLGICVVKGGIVSLTPSGKKMTPRNALHLFSNALEEIEPFTSASEVLRHSGPMSTREVSDALMSRNVYYNTDPQTNMAILRNLFIKWAMRTGLFSYDSEEDVWKCKRS